MCVHVLASLGSFAERFFFLFSRDISMHARRCVCMCMDAMLYLDGYLCSRREEEVKRACLFWFFFLFLSFFLSFFLFQRRRSSSQSSSSQGSSKEEIDRHRHCTSRLLECTYTSLPLFHLVHAAFAAAMASSCMLFFRSYSPNFSSWFC